MEWTHPTWTKVNQDRQAETDAAGRLAAIDTRLDRSALRGAPRAEHTPGADPSQPLTRPPSRGPQR